MSTRFYLDSVADTVPISPTPDFNWEDTSLLARVLCSTTKSGESLVSVSFTDGSNANKDILFRQYISPVLTAGQTITGLQSIKAQCRVSEDQTLGIGNMFFTVGIRIIASDGTTVQKTVLAVTRDDVEASENAVLTNRRFTATSEVTNYAVVPGDRFVIEIGMGGDPTNPLGRHDSTMQLGSSSSTDLSEDDTSTTDNNPWVQLSDTLTFSTQSQAPRSAHQFRQRRI